MQQQETGQDISQSELEVRQVVQVKLFRHGKHRAEWHWSTYIRGEWFTLVNWWRYFRK